MAYSYTDGKEYFMHKGDLNHYVSRLYQKQGYRTIQRQPQSSKKEGVIDLVVGGKNQIVFVKVQEVVKVGEYDNLSSQVSQIESYINKFDSDKTKRIDLCLIHTDKDKENEKDYEKAIRYTKIITNVFDLN